MNCINKGHKNRIKSKMHTFWKRYAILEEVAERGWNMNVHQIISGSP